jgi:hypothetical protein
MLGATKIYISMMITLLVFLLTFVISYLSSILTKEIFITYSSQLINSFDIIKEFVKNDYIYLSLGDIMAPVIISTTLGIISSFIISLRFVVKKI